MKQIKSFLKKRLLEKHERVLCNIHPARLNLCYNMLKAINSSSPRIPLLLDWFMYSYLLERIKVKVEHWNVSTKAGLNESGVYEAGIIFSRYDKIIRDFPDEKLEKVIKIARKIIIFPKKEAIQKLGQDLISETGFDEHLYFTD